MTDRGRADVEAAIEQRSFRLVYQPIVHLGSGTPSGVEALCRFDDGRPPATWFEECEAYGLAGPMDLAIMATAMADLDQLPEGFLALNLSPATLARPDELAETLRPALTSRTVVLELTEHAAIEDYTVALDSLARLRDAGALLAVDDAGAGYSTFRHILRLSPDIIKLDRSIIERIHEDSGRRALTSALVIFAAEINAHVIAEGIETEAELETLRAAGVGRGQGFLLARPASLPLPALLYEPRPFPDLFPNAIGQGPLEFDRSEFDATMAVLAHDALASMAAIGTAVRVLAAGDGELPQEEYRAICSVMQRRSEHVTQVLKSVVRGAATTTVRPSPPD